MVSCSALKHANVAVTELMKSLEALPSPSTSSICVFRCYLFFYCFHFQEGPLTVSTQESGKHSDLFSSLSPVDRGTKSRTKTVLSLFDEEEDKTEDQNSVHAPKRELGKVSKKL